MNFSTRLFKEKKAEFQMLILRAVLNKRLSQDGVDRPSDICLDREKGELYCLNLFGEKAVVKYRRETGS